MLFNFDDSRKDQKIPDSLKDYFLKRCDMTDKQYEELLKMAKELPGDLLIKRMKTMADYFYRLKNDKDSRGIYNEYAYAKKIILSDSFFENQKIDHTIPTVEETEKYLKEIQRSRREKPGVEKKDFHKRVENIKKLYEMNFEDEQDRPQKAHGDKSKKKMASVLKKLEDEEQIKSLEHKIIPVYKGLVSCELEYRLFKSALMNVYLYHGEKAFEDLLQKIKERKNLSIEALTKMRQNVINKGF